jgi:DNA-nicking Smr family endonuclease
VRVIYGGGKGILREKVLRYLQRHPMVDTLVEQGGSCIVFLSYN